MRVWPLHVVLSKGTKLLGENILICEATSYQLCSLWPHMGYVWLSGWGEPPLHYRGQTVVTHGGCSSKTVLHTWLQDHEPPFTLFLEKLSFLMKMDGVGASLHKETRVQKFFNTWESFIAILPLRVRQLLFDCFQPTTWYQERLLLGDTPIDLWDIQLTFALDVHHNDGTLERVSVLWHIGSCGVIGGPWNRISLTFLSHLLYPTLCINIQLVLGSGEGVSQGLTWPPSLRGTFALCCSSIVSSFMTCITADIAL